ncbi:MAG: hypothetical protein Q8P61_09450 [Candidatus Nanopelagicales bacterium]|nr:hypothetical protein [Candidatus Nanopelagicales bacterium]
MRDAISDGSGSAGELRPGRAEVACRFDGEILPEVSGLAASIRHPGVLWTHNDSGDDSRIFAIDASDCRMRAEVRLTGVTARDAEAIAVGRDAQGDPVIWLADIGDNRDSWDSVRLYRIGEPRRLVDQAVAASSFTIRYEDGPRDAEALLVDPSPGGAIWLATKRQAADGGMYRVPDSIVSKGSAVARRVGSVPAMTSDGSYAPDGRHFVLRTYTGATLFRSPPPGSGGQAVAIPLQPQGEAIAFSHDSRSLFLASERSDQLWRLPLD